MTKRLPPTVLVGVRVPREEAFALKLIAKQQDRTISQLIRESIRKIVAEAA